MLVLLSPSKTQDFSLPPSLHSYTQPALLAQAQVLIKALCKLSQEDIIQLMVVSKKIAALNYERYRSFRTPLTPANARQAIFAFQGDVYEGFNVASLDEIALVFAQEHLRILSGLYGILRPLDLIQPYRLEMKTRLKNPHGKDLYDFWGDCLTVLLNEQLCVEPSKILVNLASEEYFKAINHTLLSARIITPQFKEKKNGTYKMIGLFAKKARGKMARYIAERQITNPDSLQFFAEDGYRLNAALSTAVTPVYTRG